MPCSESNASAEFVDQCRFQAVLQARGADSVFKIVETNDFKQLAHIALAFRPGSDMAIKQVRGPLFVWRFARQRTNYMQTCNNDDLHSCVHRMA